jgi:hypothetical protein
MTVVVAIWMAAFAGMYSAREPEVALRWARAAYLGVPFIAPAVYWFTVEILRIEQRRRLAHVAAWSFAAFFSGVAVTTDRLIPNVQLYWWGFYPRYSVGVGAAFLTFFFGYLILSLVEFIRAYPAAHGAEQKRVRGFMIAFAIAYLGCVDYLPKYGIAAYPFGYVPIRRAHAVARGAGDHRHHGGRALRVRPRRTHRSGQPRRNHAPRLHRRRVCLQAHQRSPGAGR